MKSHLVYMFASVMCVSYAQAQQSSAAQSDVQGVLLKQQTTATAGLVWWWGRKEGSW